MIGDSAGAGRRTANGQRAARFPITNDQSRIAAPTGFSLIELLVALAVFALVVVGLLNLSGAGARTTVQVERSVLAGIVADNLAAEAMLAEPAALSVSAQGVERLGERDWRWQRKATIAGDDALLRIDIEVADDAGGLATTAVVFR